MTYDIAGRPKKYRNNNVEWNGSQMTKYGRNTYEYDGNNYRVFKQTPSEKTYYSYDGSGNLRFERRGRTEINYVYDAVGIRGMKVTVPTDDPSTYYASSEFYYVKDSLGNIRVILDKSGNIMVEYNYDAWGNFVAEKVREVSIGSATVDLAELNAFTYRGYYYDKESGLYYLINRYYDPTTGRFISPDDVGYLDFESFFGTNRYAYCLDNPVMYIDPFGHFTITTFLISLAIGVLISWGLSEVFGSQIAGGISSTVSGGTAIYTGIGLLSFGPVGWIAGGALILIGAGTMAFGVNEIVAGATGTNYIQSWTGMSDKLYNGLYIGLNIASDIGTIAGNMYMKYNPRYPGNNPNRIPDGFNDRVNPKANYYNPKTGQSLRPDLQHAAPINPHWDWKDSNEDWWRLYRFFRKRK